MEAAEVQLSVVFTTKLPEEYRISNVPMVRRLKRTYEKVLQTVPGSSKRGGLSKVVNSLLGLDPPRPFDFVVEGVLLRTTLQEHCTRQQRSVESAIEIEYLPVVLPPKEQKKAVHDDWIACVDGKGRTFLTAFYDGCIKGWTRDLECEWSITAHEHVVSDVTWIPGSMMFLSASQDTQLKAWTFPDGNNTPEAFAILKGHSDPVCRVAVSPDAKHCCSVGWNAAICLWPCGEALIEIEGDIDHPPKRKKTETPIPTAKALSPVKKLKGHEGCISDVIWPRKQTLYTAGWDHTIRKWDAIASVEIDTYLSHRVIHSIASPSDGSSIVAFGSADAVLRVWDSRITNNRATLRCHRGHTNWIVSVSWSPSSDFHLVTGSYDGTLRVWDIRGEVPLMTLPVNTEKCLTVDWYEEWSIVCCGTNGMLHRYDLSPSLSP